jgi:uncharacterized protein (DUF58 family)
VTGNYRIRFQNIGLYAFGVIVLYLASSYFGGFLFALFYFFLFLPLLSILSTLIAHFNLAFDQRFDVEYPIKGQNLKYHLYLTNNSIFPIVRLNVGFKTFRAGLDFSLKGFSTYLLPKATQKRTFDLTFEFRGVYNVGLEKMEIEDAFGFLAIEIPVTFKTIYIFPRINYLREVPLVREGYQSYGLHASRAGDPDYALFKQLNEYREGESIRHMYWKRYVNAGLPYIKEFEQTATSKMTVYLDTRSYNGNGRPSDDGVRAALEVEDTSVEILVSLVKFFIDDGIPVLINAAGDKTYRYDCTHPAHFEPFYKSTMRLAFQSTTSPAVLYKTDTRGFISDKNTLILITHLPDRSVVGLMDELRRRNQTVILIVNEAGFSERDRSRARSYLEELSKRGGHVAFVSNADTITDDLGD